MELQDAELIDLEDEEDPLDSRKGNTLTSLPQKSKEVYEIRYKMFMSWIDKSDIKNPFSEESVLRYFLEMSRKTTPNTLWTNYSMLRSTLGVYQNVDISKYVRLRGFLKRKSKGYKPKKSKMLSTHEINQFLQEAPDSKYLLHKVALIVAICTACRKHQLVEFTVDDVEYIGSSSVLIKMKHSRTGRQHLFSITGEYFKIFKKYADLRPPNTLEKRFFLNYQNEKCTRQPVGINKFGVFPKQIAAFLGLKEPESYTGHCFKKSSTTLVVDSSGELATLRRRLRWEPQMLLPKEPSTNSVGPGENTVSSVNNESSCSSSSYSNRSVAVDGNYCGDALQLPPDSAVGMNMNRPPPPPIYARQHQQTPDGQSATPTINYLADALPCPPRLNDSVGLKIQQDATKIFTGLCPETMRVKAVYPNVGTGKYPCSWRVDYEDTNNGQSLTNEQILTKLEARRPHYSKMIFIRKTIIPPMWSVEYGVMDCQCRDGITSKPTENGTCYFSDMNFDIVPKSEDMDLNAYDNYE